MKNRAIDYESLMKEMENLEKVENEKDAVTSYRGIKLNGHEISRVQHGFKYQYIIWRCRQCGIGAVEQFGNESTKYVLGDIISNPCDDTPNEYYSDM